jgi:hypothetical protein
MVRTEMHPFPTFDTNATRKREEQLPNNDEMPDLNPTAWTIDKVLTYSHNGSYAGRIHASIVNVPTKSADAIMPSPDCELMTIAHRDPAKPPFIS